MYLNNCCVVLLVILLSKFKAQKISYKLFLENLLSLKTKKSVLIKIVFKIVKKSNVIKILSCTLNMQKGPIITTEKMYGDMTNSL